MLGLIEVLSTSDENLLGLWQTIPRKDDQAVITRSGCTVCNHPKAEQVPDQRIVHWGSSRLCYVLFCGIIGLCYHRYFAAFARVLPLSVDHLGLLVPWKSRNWRVRFFSLEPIGEAFFRQVVLGSCGPC